MNAIADALHEELTELADAGCPIIQVEEPCIHETVGIIERMGARVLSPAEARKKLGLKKSG